jgi:AraC-like DNA-binding protein
MPSSKIMALDTAFAPSEANRRLAALIERCEPLGAQTGSAALIWSLAGMRRIVAEAEGPLPLADCLILAGVMAHLVEGALRAAAPVSPVPADLAAVHREVFSFMERCAWAAAAPPPPQTAEPRVDRALHYLRDHYGRPDLTMNDAARHVGLERHYLGRLLLQYTGRGFLAHLHDLRIREARRLLVVTTLSVKEVAAGVGYSDSTQFCRQFKRICKTSPGAYRRAARSVSSR